LSGVREFSYGRLSQDIVPYTTLEETIQYVQHKIVTHGNVSMYMIPSDIRELHKQAIVYYMHFRFLLLIISLLIPLMANRNEFMSYKIIKHDVTVPNSDIYTRLESEVEYIAIKRETMQ